jgi:hypothetical protein
LRNISQCSEPTSLLSSHWKNAGAKHYRFAHAPYDDLRARGKRAAGAFCRIVRSFSRVLYALIRDGKALDEDLYIAALKKRGVTWAQAL